MNKLINISEASAIAIHSLSLISKTSNSINAARISKLSGYSKNHLSKVLQVLVKHGYLSSNRGPRGGFRLIQDATTISLYDIYSLFEGRTINNKSKSDKCPFENDIFGDIISQMSEIFIKAFNARTIADVKWKDGIIAEEFFKTA